MSILSTNQKLIKVGQDYSAGENIGIYEHTISSRNWSPDITYAAESAFQRATGYTDTQISALSSEVSAEVSQLGSDIQYISGVALTAHQSLDGYLTKASGDEYYQPIGSYATVSQLESTSGEIVNLIPTDYVNTETLEQTSGNIVNLIPDTSEFITNVSAEQTYQHIGNYLSSNALEGYATEQWVENKGYITGVDLSNYYTKNETSGAEELENAFSQIGPGGDEEVNELVHSNSGEWNNVSAKLDSTAFSTVSGDFLTSIPDEYATKDFVSNSITGKLDISSFSSVSGDFLTNEDLNGYATEQFVENVSGDITALIPTNYYPDNNPSGFITGVDLTPYQTIEGMTAYQPVGDYATTTQVNELSGAIDYVSANAGDQEVHNIVHTNSATWNTVSDKLDSTAFSDVSGSFLTAHQDLSDYYTKSQTSGADELAQAFADIPLGDEAVNSAVHELSGTWNTVTDKLDTTSFSEVSGTFLTAHQAISAEEWNSCYDNVNTNSGAWGGEALPITGRDGIDLEIDNGTLYIGASAMTGSIDYIQTNSANIDETVGCVQTNSGSWDSCITGVSHDSTLSGDGTTGSPIGVAGDYIKMLSVNQPYTAAGQNYVATATVPDGYKFLCWVNMCTNGFSQIFYPLDPTATTCTWWLGGSNSTPGEGDSVDSRYLVIKQ